MSDTHRILLVIGDSELAMSLGSALQRECWEVVPAADAVLAQTLARQSKPDVVIVDMRLPGGGGVTVLQRLPASLNTALTPAIGLAEAEPGGDAMLRAGAQEALVKPIDPVRLVAAVRRMLGLTLPAAATAPAHAIEAPDRLHAVRASGLLDSPPDAAFDLLTRMAAAIFSAPTALLSVVDADRQFFKSAVGLRERWMTARQAPLTHSLCQWAVASGEPLIVSDTQMDPLLRHSPAIQELGVVAYAGVPVHGGGAQPIGAFCIMDSHTRDWSEADVQVLTDLADVACAEFSDAEHTGPPAPQLQRSVTASLRLLAEHGSTISPEDREAFAALVERHASRLSTLATATAG